MLSPFKNDTYSVNMNLVVKLLEQMDSEKDDWKAKRFVGYINNSSESSFRKKSTDVSSPYSIFTISSAV